MHISKFHHFHEWMRAVVNECNSCLIVCYLASLPLYLNVQKCMCNVCMDSNVCQSSYVSLLGKIINVHKYTIKLSTSQ